MIFISNNVGHRMHRTNTSCTNAFRFHLANYKTSSAEIQRQHFSNLHVVHHALQNYAAWKSRKYMYTGAHMYTHPHTPSHSPSHTLTHTYPHTHPHTHTHKRVAVEEPTIKKHQLEAHLFSIKSRSNSLVVYYKYDIR